MPKICPECKKPQTDPRLLRCETCKCAFVDQTELVGRFTKEELRSLASELGRPDHLAIIAAEMAKRPVFILISFVSFVVGMYAIYSFLSHQIDTHIGTLQTNLTSQIHMVYSRTTNDLNFHFEAFSRSASNQIASAYSAVTDNINNEFKTERIRQIMADVASNQSKVLLEADVKPAVARFADDTEFLRMATRARAYDFKAYLSLIALAMQTNENAVYAGKVVAEVDRSLESMRANFIVRSYMQVLGTNFYRGPFASDEIALRFAWSEANRFSLNREGFVNTARDFHEPLFLGFFVQLFTNETDLVVADRISLAISELTKQDFHPRDSDAIMRWWMVHEGQYTNYPIGELTNGMASVSDAKYSQATEFLERVLQRDVSADMSRYMLIASYLDIGASNRALVLSKGFHDSSGRWAQIASTKIELETGSVTNATVQLARIARDFPTLMEVGATPYYFETWRKVNRQLFDKAFASPAH